MRLDYLKDRKEPVSLVLLGLSAVLGLVILVRIAGFFVTSARAEKLIEDAAALSKPDPNDTEKYFAESKEIADKLKKKNLFAPPPKKENPVKGVSMIITNEAFINGKWHKVGDKIGDAEVLEIKPTSVKIKWESEEKTHRVFEFKGPEEPKKRERVVDRPGREGKDEKPDTAKKEGPEGRRPPRARRDFSELSEEQRERMRERRRQRGSREGRRRRGSRRERGGREGRRRRERDE
ncbi:MAG: hypothetical protein ACYTEL_06160 [Planctomycetota bacterium]|jgi:hypothetical protein